MISKVEYTVRLVGVSGEKEGEGRINGVIAEMLREGWSFKEIQYRSYEFQGIRHSALVLFERNVLPADVAPKTGNMGGVRS